MGTRSWRVASMYISVGCRHRALTSTALRSSQALEAWSRENRLRLRVSYFSLVTTLVVTVQLTRQSRHVTRRRRTLQVATYRTRSSFRAAPMPPCAPSPDSQRQRQRGRCSVLDCKPMCKPQAQRRSERARASGKRNTKADPYQHGTQSHTLDDAFHRRRFLGRGAPQLVSWAPLTQCHSHRQAP